MKTIEDIELLSPATLAEALRLQASDKTRGVPMAGGTDLVVQWQSSVRPIPDRAISNRSLKELQGIRDVGAAIEIGAGVTHAELRASSLAETFSVVTPRMFASRVVAASSGSRNEPPR